MAFDETDLLRVLTGADLRSEVRDNLVSLRWAHVTKLEPLQVRREGEFSDIDITGTAIPVEALRVGDKVRVSSYGAKAFIESSWDVLSRTDEVVFKGPNANDKIREDLEEQATAVQEAQDAAQNAVDEAGQALAGLAEAVTSYVYEYVLSPSATSPPEDGWSTTPPTRTPGSYIWQRVRVVRANGDDAVSAPVLVTGNEGPKGDDGKSVTIEASVPTAADLPTGLTEADAGKGWITDNDGHLHVWSGTSWTDVGEIRGPEGRSVTSVDVLYYLSSSPTELLDGTWLTNAPTWTPGRYMWTRTVTNYSTGEPTPSSPVSISGQQGQNGDPGRSIESVEEQYYLSTSATSLEGGSWESTPPTWIPGRYYWTRSEINYSYGPASYTDPLMSTGSPGAPGDTGVGITSVTSFFRLQVTGTDAPPTPVGLSPTGWSETEPAYVPDRELWRSERIVFSDDSVTWTTPQKSSAYAAAAYVANLADAALQGLVKVQPDDPGHYEGRIWWQTNAEGHGIGIKVSVGGEWVSYMIAADQILVPSSIGPVQIADGAITAPKLKTGSIQIGHFAEDTSETISSEITSATDQLGSSLSSEFTETIDSLPFSDYTPVDTFNTRTGDIDTAISAAEQAAAADLNAARAELADQIESINTTLAENRLYIDINPTDGIRLGHIDNSLNVQITNDRLSFLEGNTEVAYISNQKLYITTAEVTDQLIITRPGLDSSFYFDPRENGNLSFRFRNN